MERITVSDVTNTDFYKLYKFLFNDEYIDLSNDAKIMYTLLRDRLQLSIKNNWVNKNNEVYLIYTINELMDMLRTGNQKIIKLKKELSVYGLLQEERQGHTKPNLLFLTAETSINTMKCENHISRSVKITSHEVSKSHSNKTNSNNTDNSNTNTKYLISSIEYLSNPELNNLFVEYLKVRKENNISTPEYQIVGLINRLKKLADGSEFMMKQMLLTSIKRKLPNFWVPNTYASKDIEESE